MTETLTPYKIHFCFGFSDQPAPFLFIHYLAVKSAALANPRAEITIHYVNTPSGEWWERAGNYATLERTTAPQTIHGRPLVHFAHKADVFRLQVLLERGGIYLDMDTLCLRPFADLLQYPCVMARQRSDDYGLCNAVILSKPDSMFIKEWLGEYAWFRSRGRDGFWDEHSVRVPMQLLQTPSLKDTVTVLPYVSFFYPDCRQPAPLFTDADVSPWKDSYSIHLWETINMGTLVNLTPESIWKGNSAYCRLARQFMSEEQ